MKVQVVVIKNCGGPKEFFMTELPELSIKSDNECFWSN